MAFLATCPNCDTRYSLNDSRVPVGQSRLKCSKCKEIFLITKKTTNAKPKVETSTPTTPVQPPEATPSPVAPKVESPVVEQSVEKAPTPPEPAFSAPEQGTEPQADFSPDTDFSTFSAPENAQVPTPAVPETPAVKERSPAPKQKENGEIVVIAANSDESITGAISDALTKAGMKVTRIHDGVEALEAAESQSADVVILDVSLPRLYGFEVCEHIRDNPELSHTKIILSASVYDETRYKRKPVSLYGADDYIEKHHIHDLLPDKVKCLVETGKPLDTTNFKPSFHTMAISEEAEQEVLAVSEAPITSTDPEGEEKARRLARIIVSDILLYNAEEITEGLQNGTVFTLLEDDIKDGLSFIRTRVPEELPAETYLKEALEEFIEKKKVELDIDQSF
ncbi:MAG: zinc-ribbon domain-containing protein [Deltaproteobacteria bacterium]|nr:zinc-ribbon domain-containing protein [Deltaproteobacteria bacterium]